MIGEWYKKLAEIGAELTEATQKSSQSDLFSQGEKPAISPKELRDKVDAYRKLVASFVDLVNVAKDRANAGEAEYKQWRAEQQTYIRNLQNENSHETRNERL